MINPNAQIQELVLDRLQVGMAQTFPRNVEVEVAADFLGRYFQANLRTEVLARTLDKRTHTKNVKHQEPASPWQMFKRKHAHSWWLRWLVERRPVEYSVWYESVTVEVEAKAIYPEASIKMPDYMGRQFIIHAITEVDREL